MQAKRNSVSNSSLFNSKTNNLIQPFISISKASTPLRTRIIGSNNMQPNSTPINFSKAAVLNNKSPNNKENFNNNHIKLQSSMKTFTIPSEPQNRINLSPIISLNRKLSEGPKFQQKKSHTPQNHKVMQEYQMNMVSSGRQGKQKRYQTLTGSNSGFNNFSNTGNFSNLRGSNSFKNLIEGRCKTPNKDTTTSSLFPLKRQTPLLKQSSSSNLLFKNFHNQESKFQNNLKLAQSKSYDKMKTFSSINSDFSEIKCMNNDGKKAKYRVLNNDDYDSEQKSEIQLYYCSKCTIPLVQQGFIVEEIGKQSIKIDISGNDRILDEIRQKLQNKKKAFIFAINDIQSKQQQQVSQLQMYYNKMFEYLELQRQKDLNLICQYYNEKKDISKDYINEIDHKIAYLQNKSLPITKILNDHSISSLIDINQNNFLIDSKFQINSAQLFNKFIETFNAYLKLHFQQNKQAKFNDISNRNHAMRFSFQKLLNDKNTKKGGINIKNYMNPLKEQDEEQNDDEDVQTENTAFRDLFPADEQESSHLNNDMTSPTFKKI